MSAPNSIWSTVKRLVLFSLSIFLGGCSSGWNVGPDECHPINQAVFRDCVEQQLASNPDFDEFKNFLEDRDFTQSDASYPDREGFFIFFWFARDLANTTTKIFGYYNEERLVKSIEISPP
ncbi:hypothetical protein [Synechococcus sp. PCC 7336]|uniref:hypothetical protein n=1 Tax=Synechococcus sp. PCC 7336 TaxID=195250 RepID=UPI0012EA5C30|nr:hypothetical protein [Synechococcus sp. PCC 7336]